MIILDKLEQGTQEWLDARCGVITASEFKNIITPTGKPITGLKRENYLYDIIHERISNKAIFTPPSHAMQRGHDLEPEARNAFEFIKDIVTDQVGIVYLDKSKKISCSPDSLIGKKSGLEIKCPLHRVHLKTVIRQEMPSEHIPQVHGSMWVTGRDNWWFCSYHPDHETFITLIKRDNDYISKLEKAVNSFEKDIYDYFQTKKAA